MTSPTASPPSSEPAATATSSATPVPPAASPTARPAFSPKPRRNGSIAFVSERSGTADLYLVEPTGGTATRLTRGPARDLEPAWSPDGSQVAFVRATDAEGTDGRIVIVDLATRRERTIGPDVGDISQAWLADAEPAWSPDGTQLAVSRSLRAPRRGLRAVSDIFVLGTDGKPQRQITTNAVSGIRRHRWPAWTPDGLSLVFVELTLAGVDFGGAEVHSAAADGTTKTTVIRRPRQRIGAPTVAPDGSAMAFTVTSQGSPALWEIYVAGTEQAPTPVRGAIALGELGDPSWTPDATRLAFASAMSTTTRLHIVDLHDGPPTTVLAAPGLGRLLDGPLWSPDGRSLLYASEVDGQTELFRLDVAGTGPARLTDDPADDHSPAWQALAP